MRMNMKHLKTLLLLFLLFLLATQSVGIPSEPGMASPAAAAAPQKPLVIYYSRLGTTRTIAREMDVQLSGMPTLPERSGPGRGEAGDVPPGFSSLT